MGIKVPFVPLAGLSTKAAYAPGLKNLSASNGTFMISIDEL